MKPWTKHKNNTVTGSIDKDALLLSKFISELRKEKDNDTVQLYTNAEGKQLYECKNIISMKAYKSYSIFNFRDGKKIITSTTIGHFEKTFNTKFFYRTHKSHMVNLLHISKVVSGKAKQLIMIDGSTVPVSRRRFEKLFSKLFVE